MIDNFDLLISGAFLLYLLGCAIIYFLIFGKKSSKARLNNCQESKMLNGYRTPKQRILTDKQIEMIHSKGKLTPAEKVKEWESHDLCAPGDAIGSAKYRCRKFNHNCHDCLVDYANQNDEYEPINFKIVNKAFSRDCN